VYHYRLRSLYIDVFIIGTHNESYAKNRRVLGCPKFKAIEIEFVPNL